MTGLTPPSRRQIEQDTKQYGGKYSGELHEGVTHLISLKPEGKKYEYAIKNNIKVVSPLWHTDCVERCGQVNPSKYQLEGIPAVRSAQAKGQVMGKGKGKAEAIRIESSIYISRYLTIYMLCRRMQMNA